MKHRKIFRPVVACALALLMLPGMHSWADAAQSSSEIKNQIDSLESQKADIESQIGQLQTKLSDNMNKAEETAAQKAKLDQEIFLLCEQIDTINQQISAYEVLIADKQRELVAAEVHLAELNAQNKERIRAMEENGKISYWSVLFQANSFSDFLDRLDMVNEIAASDRRRLKEMSEAAAAVAEAKSVLETEKAGFETTKQELDSTQKSMEDKRAQADRLLNELHAQGAEFETLINQSEQKQSDLMQQIAEQEAAYDSAKYREWLATSVPETTKPPRPTEGSSGTGSSGGSGSNSSSSGGSSSSGSSSNSSSPNSSGWTTPINFTQMTSPFGYRWHPIHKDWRMHYGVDLAAPTGTPIYAARSGVVTRASYEDGGAGYYVSINHGDGYASIYMHMTHFIVSAGQQVSAGQVIGYCGSTGGSTGPHLHFGISYNGVYVNPADYISI